MTPDEKVRVEAIVRIAYFALGGHMTIVDPAQRSEVTELIKVVCEHSKALGLGTKALTEPAESFLQQTKKPQPS